MSLREALEEEVRLSLWRWEPAAPAGAQEEALVGPLGG